MTRREYRKAYRSVVREATKFLRNYGEKALESGVLDLKVERHPISVAKNVLCAGADKLSLPMNFGPFTSTDQRKISRIRSNVSSRQ